jgi:choline dehydrogenase-like flavoprotein
MCIGPESWRKIRAVFLAQGLDLGIGARKRTRVCINWFATRRNRSDSLTSLVATLREARYRGREIGPGDKVQSDTEIEAWLRNAVITAHHPCGTCPMGSTPDTVLDPEMRVRGIERLRVVDASAMPDLVSAHINACVLMMAERASDIIRGRRPLEPAHDA